MKPLLMTDSSMHNQTPLSHNKRSLVFGRVLQVDCRHGARGRCGSGRFQCVRAPLGHVSLQSQVFQSHTTAVSPRSHVRAQRQPRQPRQLRQPRPSLCHLKRLTVVVENSIGGRTRSRTATGSGPATGFGGGAAVRAGEDEERS
jgi:hypothetical protein